MPIFPVAVVNVKNTITRFRTHKRVTIMPCSVPRWTPEAGTELPTVSTV